MLLLQIILFSIFFLFLTFPSYAVCPLCTVVVGGGFWFSRMIGIDDVVSGIWIGGLVVSLGLWLADWLEKKKKSLPLNKITSILIMYIFTIPSLYITKAIGIPKNTIFGIDKILFGIFIGTLSFILAVEVENSLRKKNNNKVYIYYQKVIIPVLLLTLVSFIFYLFIS